MGTSVGYGLVLAGAIGGALRPRLAMALLIGAVAVTSSLPWQLGLPNLAYPLLFAAGLLLGSFFSDAASPPPTSKDGVRIQVYAAALCLGVSALVALFRNHPLGSSAFALEMRTVPRELVHFNPAGLAGFVQALAIQATGLVLLLVAARWLADARRRTAFERALSVGALIAVASPVIQTLLLDPTVRPDKASFESVGWVGFFQDPHSYAAYLVIVGGVVAGQAGAAMLDEMSSRRVAGRLALLTALMIVLLYTGSRTGLGSAVVAAAAFTTAAFLLPGESVDVHRLRARRNVGVAIGALALAATAVLALSSSARGVAHAGLSSLGSPRTWEFLDPEGAERPLLGRRLLLWRKAARLIAEHPLFGVGPRGFEATWVEPPAAAIEQLETAYGRPEVALTLQEYAIENAHNYYLQHAAEYGLPGLATWLLVLGTIGSILIRAILHGSGGDRLRLCGVLAGLAGFLTMSLAAHPFLVAETQIAFWTVAAYGLALARASGETALPTVSRIVPSGPPARPPEHDSRPA